MSGHVCTTDPCGYCESRIDAAETDRLLGPGWDMTESDREYEADRAADAYERRLGL